MVFTVADALQLDIFNNVKLLGGSKGLEQQIRWINILELLDDTEFVCSGELLITTAYGLKDDYELQQKLIPQLKEKQLACMAIQTGHYLREVPRKIINDAEKYELPLLELPPDVSFAKITTDLLTRIVNHQFHLLEYRDKIREELLQAVLDYSNFDRLLRILGKHLRVPVGILDGDYHLIAANGANAEELQFLKSPGALKEPSLQNELVFCGISDQTGSTVSQQIIMPVVAAQNQVLGYITALNLPEKLNDMQNTVLVQAATACALLFLQEIAIKETENRFKGDFLDDLLEGNLSSEEEAYKRADFFGYDLKQNGMVMLANVDNFSGIISGRKEAEIINLKKKLLHSVELSVRAFTENQFLVRMRSDNIIILLLSPLRHPCAWQRKLAEMVRNDISRQYPEINLSIGIGSFYETPFGFGKSFAEAGQSLEIARKLQETAATAAFDELGPYRLLLQIDEQEMRNYYEETIGMLAEYDAKKGTELERTLAAFLEQDKNMQLTAEKLYIHRHTLRYRLKRIQEITGFSLHDTDAVFNLQLSLRLHKLLR